jgi:hypothetical protein
MPPHCDSMDGPVVKAAMLALAHGDVAIVLPYVPGEAEEEVRNAFERVESARAVSHDVRELADRWFFETVVRLHRLGEGVGFTGLKPAGLDHGPVVPVAELAIVRRDVSELARLLEGVVAGELGKRFARVLALEHGLNGDIEARRRYVEASLGLQVWAHRLYEAAQADGHAHGTAREREHAHAH